LAYEFIYWRYFGFNQLSHGNLALWNPHVFCGVPFFGGLQSALLYPPNFLYMVLPLALATNVSIVLHILLAGLSMFLWAWYRGLKPQACFVSAVLLMFCGAFFMHVYAGHLSNLCAMAWVPLIFLCIDGIFDKRTLNWAILGVAAVSMHILAGHPQYVFYTAIASAIYCALSLLNQPQRIRVLSLLAIMGIWAGLLVAVQLLTGIQESSYTIRGDGGVEYELAAIFSFPPENLITLISPDFLGSLPDQSYWGRCFLWEMSLFFSVTGLVLAVYGQVYGSARQRHFCMTLIIILFILALGAHTPLFGLLYRIVPGFNKFRGNSKFTFQMMVFAVMLAGIGLHRLINNKPSWRWIIGIASVAIILTVMAGIIAGSVSGSGIDGWWHDFMKLIKSAADKFRESYVDIALYDDSNFVRSAAHRASKSLLAAAGSLLLLAGFFALKRRWNYVAVYAIIILVLAELLVFALQLRPTFNLTDVKLPQEFKKEISSTPGDFRILDMPRGNDAMMEGMFDITGYDPGVLRRYSEFMAFTQGIDPGNATTQYPGPKTLHSLFSMLRVQYVIQPEGGQLQMLYNREPILPRLLLVNDFKILKDRDSIFSLLDSPTFNPNQTVILESQPQPLPQPSDKPGTAKIVDESTDYLTIEADINSPAILLVTDAYHPNWHAEPLAGSCQKKYQVMPANYVLRAVPLQAGHHIFRMEYRPRAFVIGMWISIVSLTVYLCLCLQRLYSFRRTR
jgi:hypothetical protein